MAENGYSGIVAFQWNFFISKQALTAERRYEKEKQCKTTCMQAAFGARTYLFSLLPGLTLPLTPASNKCCSAQTQTRIGLLEEIPRSGFRFPAFTTGPLRRTRTLCDQAQTPV